MGDWKTLKDQIKEMLLSGKRGDHPDYIPFFNMFGKEKIVALAKEIKNEEKEKENASEKS